MPYATQDQIVIACGGQTVFDQLFDNNEDGTADADVIAQAQTAADALINSYLWTRYKTVANPSPVLQMLAAEEAVYHVRKYKPALGLSAQDIADHADRIKTLEGMSKGMIRPDVDDPAPSGNGAKAVFIENCSPMSRARSRGVIW